MGLLSAMGASVSGMAAQANYLATISENISNSNTTGSSPSRQTLTNQISGRQMASTSVSANRTVFQQLAQAYTMVADLGTQNLSSAAIKQLAVRHRVF